MNFPGCGWRISSHGDGRKTQLTNTNKLIRLYEGCDGGKTGSTKEAGYCMAATAQRAACRLVAVVLGASSSTGRSTRRRGCSIMDSPISVGIPWRKGALR